MSLVLIHESFIVPSGVIPGNAEVLVQEWLWTRLCSPSGVRGLLYKRQGLDCSFPFSLDQYVMCTLLILR
jgi:hypothetical protein